MYDFFSSLYVRFECVFLEKICYVFVCKVIL